MYLFDILNSCGKCALTLKPYSYLAATRDFAQPYQKSTIRCNT